MIGRLRLAVRRRHNWVQLAKFCVVGASGYLVNLGVYAALLHWAGLHYLWAAVCSFVVAVANNYWWNRHWTFAHAKGHFAYQGVRFFIVSALAFGVNQLFLFLFLDVAGLGKVLSQAIAILFVVPLNFLGNKLWSFRLARPAPSHQ